MANLTENRLCCGGKARLKAGLAWLRSWITSPQYEAGLAQIDQLLARSTSRWAGHTLYESSDWRVALFGMAPWAELPLHDHPGTRGLVHVVDGTVRVNRFEIGRARSSTRFAELRHRGSRHLVTGDSEVFGRRYHNIHALQAGAERTLILSARNRLGAEREGSLYTPLSSDESNLNGLIPAFVLKHQLHAHPTME